MPVQVVTAEELRLGMHLQELSDASHEQIEAVDLQGRGLLHHAALANDAECREAAASLAAWHFAMELNRNETVRKIQLVLKVRTVIRLTPRQPLELAEEATVDGVESLKALIEMGVPFDKHMGPGKLDDGSVVLVRTREADEEVGAEWQLALVRGLAGNNLTVKFHGTKETKVLIEQCEVAPTPLVLAEKLGQQVIYDLSVKLFGWPGVLEEDEIGFWDNRCARE
ncbi:ift122 [Symbiodinium natans]|uniref:Ift122 protein n=1 Tax=Symbiodinium natans TaxID=878477 RepID=A0A812V0L6_9DINO|nr:ift122 [Symbiodinium natans]